jgi:hypothetical protein
MNKRRDDEYNVNNYSDSEIYDLLDLVNPSDRVLEAKIIQMINRYANMQNDSGRKLVTFFKHIYDRFFDGGNEDEPFIENIQAENELSYTPTDKSISGNYVGTTASEAHLPTSQSTTDIMEGFDGIQNSDAAATTPYIDRGMGPNPTSGIVQPPPATPATAPPAGSGNIKTNQLEYSKDYLNPLLKQTVKRIISIDSQYRDNKNSLSTNFTFNLSEPLKDVVSLSLYSVQIPYTWYTINNNFGGNFFYLKGNSPGIATGDFDYQIDISSGNYGPNDLVTAINNRLTLLQSTYPDISFGNTNINYNANTGLAKMNINIQNLFSETDYQLVFPTDPSLNSYPITVDPTNNVQQLRYSSNPVSTLSSYLGYNRTSYVPNVVYSSRNIVSSNIADNAVAYKIDTSNNFFNIYQYQGPNLYDPNSVVFGQTITLDISGTLSRNAIFTNVNQKLSQNSYFDSSNTYLKLSQISDLSADQYPNYYYEFHVKWNKKMIPTANIAGLKTVIVFPNESYVTGQAFYTTWTNPGNSPTNLSCFGFPSTICEINNVVAESTSLQTNYVINSHPYIGLICTASGYTSGFANYPYLGPGSSKIHADPSWNDYIIDISNSTNTGGYSLADYLTTINNAISITNTKSINNSNPVGVFNLQYSNISDNISTNNKVSLKFDINRRFRNDAYYVDLTQSFLYKTLNLGKDASGIYGWGNGVDLSNQNVFTSTITALPGYLYDTADVLVKIYPKSYVTSRQPNANADPWYVLPSGSALQSFNNTNVFSTITNQLFQQFQDAPGSNPLLATNLSIVVNANGTITSTLTINVNKILTQNDYTAVFYDPSHTAISDFSNNCWAANLNIADPSYNLYNLYVPNTSYSEIVGSKTLSGYTYTINKDTYFTLQPITYGITTPDNVITIPIPAASAANNFSYTRQDLYNIINTAFSANPLTSGSTIYTQIVNGNQYVAIRLNINKLYTANDYRLVFYDPFSFVKCNFGLSSTQNATWDSTLGWILGFRASTEYNLSNYYDSNSVSSTIIGDTTITTNIYNYFLIVLDDYTQSHLNDGLVTLTPHESQIALPSYTSKTAIQCDPSKNTLITGSAVGNNGNNLTQNQIYAANQIILASKNQVKTYSNGPFIQDIFGLIPMKVAGLAVGSFYIEFGGTLQNQQRLYFGPVNIHRMTIKLITDRGDNVDLNGSNWSFSFVCEQLYQQTSI